MSRYKFDFPAILFELVRNNMPLASLRRFAFVDTLAILEAARAEAGACLKLQCLARRFCDEGDLRAHRVWRRTKYDNDNAFYIALIETRTCLDQVCILFRQPALDDCIALRHVMSSVATRLGVQLSDLQRIFAVSLREADSYAQIHAMLSA